MPDISDPHTPAKKNIVLIVGALVVLAAIIAVAIYIKKVPSNHSDTTPGRNAQLPPQVAELQKTVASGQEAFYAYLAAKKYPEAKIKEAREMLFKTFIKPGDPEVDAWLNGLSAQERDDVVAAYDLATRAYAGISGPTSGASRSLSPGPSTSTSPTQPSTFAR